jgi:Tol biopolymer transport system component
MADLKSGRSEAVLPGVLLFNFDIALDGKRIAYSSLNAEGSSRVWVTSLDRRTPPQQITSFEADYPVFGPTGTLVFHGREGDSDNIYGVEPNDTKPRRINTNWGRGTVSPDRQWLLLTGAPLTANPHKEAPKSTSVISAKWVGSRVESTYTLDCAMPARWAAATYTSSLFPPESHFPLYRHQVSSLAKTLEA